MAKQPIRAVPFTFQIEGFYSQANPAIFQANPTIAAGDFKIALDGGNEAALTNTPTVINSERRVQFVLTAAEMTADEIIISCQDAAGSEWIALAIRIFPAGFAHGIVASGVLQAATGTTAQLASATSFADDFLNGASLIIIGGTGAGQGRVINDWVSSTDTATVDAWTTTPDNTSEYVVVRTAPGSVAIPVPANVTQLLGTAWLTPGTAGTPDVNAKLVGGTAQSAGDINAKLNGLVLAQGTIGSTGNDTTHLHLTGLAYADDDINNLLIVLLDVSTGLYHSRWISDWANTGDLATLSSALPVTPQNATDTYWILSVRQDVTGGSGLDAAGVRAAVGLGSANLDTQLGDLPTNAELATALGTADDAVLAAIGALNNLSQANIRTALGLGSANLDTQLAGIQTDATALLSRLTSARAGYLDNLNVGGNVASSAEVTSIQNNTRVVRVVPDIIERPDSGTVTYRIELFLYDAVGNMEAPDSAPTIALVNQAGTDRSSRLDSATMALVETGRYRAVYTADVADTLEQLIWTFSVVEGGATRKYGNQSVIVDTTAVDFTAADRTKLDALHAKLPSKTYLAGTSNSDGDIQLNEATGALPTDSVDANALKADAVTEIQSGLATVANQTTILARLGAWTGSARNTILGALQALFRKDADATVPSDINANLGSGAGAASNTTDSVEAIRDNMGTAQTGDAYAIVNSGTHGNAALKTLVDDVPTNAELATSQAAADDATLAAVASVPAAVLAAAAADPIAANVKEVNSLAIDGAGTEGDPWGPA